MPRNSSGTYTLPSSQFQQDTTISSTAVNANFSDIATAITQSMPTTGVAPMTGALVMSNMATAASPAIAFSLSPATGWYLVSAGVWGFSAVGVLGIKSTSAGLAAVPSSGANFVDRGGGLLSALPVGIMADYGIATPPALWLACGGQAVSRSTYALLFAAIGTTFGTGDGISTFNVPDCRNRVVAGADNMGGTPANRLTNNALNGISGIAVGNTGGTQALTILQANMPSANATHTLGVTLTNSTNIVDYSVVISRLPPTPGGVSIAGVSSGLVGSSITTTGNISSGGSGTAANTVQPTLITGKIIYAGV